MTAQGPSGEMPPRSSPSWSDLGPRVISAAVLVAVIATGLYFGGYVWAALAAVVFGITYREWEQMVTLKPLAPLGMVLIGLLAVAAIAFQAFGPVGTIAVVALGIVVSLFGERAVIPWRVGGLVFFGIVLIAVLGMRGSAPAGIIAGCRTCPKPISSSTGYLTVHGDKQVVAAWSEPLAGRLRPSRQGPRQPAV